MGHLLRVAVLTPILLAACGDSSKSELIGKAKGADTKVKLEAALGAPDDLAKVGPLEKWTYKASDGEVTFLITGETVTLELVSGSQN